MQLVDEEDDLAFAAADFIHHGLQSFFELAAEAGAGDHRAQVERNQALVGQHIRHIVFGDLLGQALDDGRLADACLSDQDGVALGAAAEYLHHAHDLFGAADDWVQLIFGGGLGEVASILFQGLELVFGVRLRDLLAAAQLLDGAVDALLGDGGVPQYVGAVGVAFTGDAEQEVFGADVFVLKFFGFFGGGGHYAVEAGGDEYLDSGDAGIGRRVGFGGGFEDCFQLAGDHVYRGADGLQYLRDCALRLLHERQEYMLGIDLRVLIFLQEFEGAGCRLLGLLGKSVKWHHGWQIL